MLRAGPWTSQPLPVDRTPTTRPTPEAFQRTVTTPTIEVLPLVKNPNGQFQSGWCTYSDAFDSPEMEVLCGGINHKTATAAAIWRQGHLLHFGFDLSPTDMNERCQALLVNCIVYINRFPDDRPIMPAPGRALLKVGADRITSKSKPEKDYLDWYFAPTVLQQGKAHDWPAFQAWYKQHRDYLRADLAHKGSFVLDEEALAAGVPPARPEFFPAMIAALQEGGENAARATLLLRRYAPSGPQAGKASDWQSWWKENQPYLFFSESGWYQWYLDPLAKKRGIPSAELRGLARATRNP